MNRIKSIFASLALLSLAFTWANAQSQKLFQGEISDSQCALNVHSLTRSHQEMLKSKSMGGNAMDCTLYCVNYHGGDFVLSSKNDVYRLDNQALARTFAGRKVKILGVLSADKKTIQVVSMKADQ
jgi:hypothetical protein